MLQWVFGMSVSVRRDLLMLFLGFVLIIGVPSGTWAAKVDNLYQQEIMVSSQGEQERLEAEGQGLSNVIIKVTGLRSVLGLPDIRDAVRNPASYLQSYSYRRENGERTGRQYLQMQFNPTLVNRLLRESNVAIWGSNRPTTLMWLAVDNQGSRQILGSNANLSKVMEGHFNTRGIPAILPLQDFEDARNISAVDVWGGFTERLESASRRYGAEAIISGRLRKSGERYTGRITLLFQEQRFHADVEDMVASGVASVASELAAKHLASHYAVAATDINEKPLLVVSNVNSVEDYAALTTYLEKLTAVREVSVHKVRGGTIELALSIDGSVVQLKDALALGRQLSAGLPPVKNAEGALTASAHLYYRWNRR